MPEPTHVRLELRDCMQCGDCGMVVKLSFGYE